MNPTQLNCQITSWIRLKHLGRLGNVSLIASLLLILTLGLMAPRAYAATITVSSLADAQGNNGQCTLREAILNANADNQSGSTDCVAGSGLDTINFSVNGTILLVSALPNISQAVIMDG